jgi:hypothetical protein
VTTFRDHEMSAASKAEHAALLRAAMQAGKTVAGGVTHDLNSALQILGDSLYAIRDDTQTLIGAAPRVSGEARTSLIASLRLADDAFERLSAITEVVPNLAMVPPDDAGPIFVEAELLAIVALTRHHWKNRLNVVVDIPTPVPQFWCRWWIVRLAAMRMVMLAADTKQRAPSNFNAERLPMLRITGLLNDGRFELQMVVDHAAGEAGITSSDSVLTLCAKCLSGSITATPTPGGSRTSLQYPVRLAASSAEEGCV